MNIYLVKTDDNKDKNTYFCLRQLTEDYIVTAVAFNDKDVKDLKKSMRDSMDIGGHTTIMYVPIKTSKKRIHITTTLAALERESSDELKANALKEALK